MRTRTNVVIDDALMSAAKKVGGYNTKKETLEAGLKLILAVNKQKQIREYQGKLKWEGNLAKMRTAK